MTNRLLDHTVAAYLVISVPILLVFSIALSADQPPRPIGHPSQIVVRSPNERFEIRIEATDDGCRIVQVDTVRGCVAVMSVDDNNEAVIGVGEQKRGFELLPEVKIRHIENGAFRCAMKTSKGFVNWAHAVELP